MENETRQINSELETLPSNRFREWYDFVPADIRRMQYKFWKTYTQKKMLSKFKMENVSADGALTVFPEYTAEQEKIDWDNFARSFVLGVEGKNKLLEMVNGIKADMPMILDKIKSEYQLGEPLLIFVGGSLSLGVRDKAAAPDTDIDLYVMFKSGQFASVSPKYKEVYLKSETQDREYQLFACGQDESERFSFMFMHPLLLPNIPVYKNISDAELMETKVKVLAETEEKKDRLDSDLAMIQSGYNKHKTEAKVIK